MLSLRRILMLTALLLGLLPAVLGALAVKLWLQPNLERQAIEQSDTLARALAQQARLYIAPPAHALHAGAQDIFARRHEPDTAQQAALDRLRTANPVLQAVYLLDGRSQVSRISLRMDSAIRAADLIGLDLSRLHSLRRPLEKEEVRWSEVFLSSISGGPAVAILTQAGSNTLVGELTLAELSHFVRNAAPGGDARMQIMDEHGQVIADPDPAIAHTYLNRSDIPLFNQARAEASATGRFEDKGSEFIGSAQRVDPQGWVVLVSTPVEQALRSGTQITQLLVSIGLALTALNLGLTIMSARWIAGRTELVVRIARSAAHQQFDFTWPTSRIPEYRLLLDSLRNMLEAIRAREQALTLSNTLLESRIEARTHELSEMNNELSETVENLKRTRDELAHSQRQAALGRLVAGVAHELNTPIGNSLIVATSLNAELQDFASLQQTGITRRQFNEFQQHCGDAAVLLCRNLQRAAELIQDFKQVAVDQSTAQRRKFDAAEVLQETTRLLAPNLQRHNCHLEIQATEELAMDSYPGPLGQIISNLVQNAMLHAYPDSGGVIGISLDHYGNDSLQLQVRDRGKGMTDDVITRIFDPFFTTRLGQGGTGLGLHIVHQLVTELLGGRIEVASQPGEGSCFTLILPQVAPSI